MLLSALLISESKAECKLLTADPLFLITVDSQKAFAVDNSKGLLWWFNIKNKVVWWHNKGITKLPNSEQSYKGKVKTHKYINRQDQSTTGKLWKP